MSRFLKENLNILLILLILVFLIQYFLLQPVLKMGFPWDDWFTLDFFKILGPNPLSKISYVLWKFGPHFTLEYWIGILVNIFGWQNQAVLREVNISLKIIETLAIYPVVLFIFKRKLLAFLSTLIFAMHYSATGALELVITGIDYLVGFFLLLFLAIYYHMTKNKLFSLRWLILLFLSLILTVSTEAVRAYPVLVLPFLIETLVLVRDHSKTSLKNSFLRLIILVPVFLMIAVFFKYSVFPGGNLSSGVLAPNILVLLLQGDWWFTLHPLAGLSTLFIPPEYLTKVFGSQILNQNNLFIDYLSFLIKVPLIFFGVLTYLLSFFIKPSWLGRWKFILTTLVLNFTAEIVIFFIYNIRYNSPPDYQNASELIGMYPIFIGTYLIILSFWAFYGWLKGGNKNNLLWAFWSGLMFSFIFLVMTRLMANWIFAYTAVHRYLLTAVLGASLSFASLLTLFYDKINSKTSILSRSFSIFLILLVLVGFYLISNQQISDFFNNRLIQGRSAQAQEMMHQKFLGKFSKYKYDPSKSSLFYFDVNGESSVDILFLQESFSSNFMYWMHLITPLKDHCIQDIGGTVESLKQFIKVKNGVRGIELNAYCIHPGEGTYEGSTPTFFMPENFYSFKVKNREFIDTRDEVLKELGFD